MASETSAAGRLLSTTVNVALPPASVVARPEVGLTVMPTASLSIFVTETSAGSIPAYLGSLEVAGLNTIVHVLSPSAAKSSTPVTVTIFGMFQLVGVNESAAGETAHSVVSLDETAINTLPVGWLLSTTVNVALPPASVVTSPDVGVTVIPAVSSSVFVAQTSFVPIAAYFASLEVTGPTTIA